MIKLILVAILSLNIYAGELFTESEQEYINNHPNVKVAMLDNFHPFSYVDNNMHKGFTVELIDKISRISGLNFSVQTANWSDTLNKFKHNEVDLITEISYTKQRENFTLFSSSYYEIPTFVFGLKSDKNYIDNDSLKGKKVGVTRNIFYMRDLEKLGIKAVQFDTSFEKAKALVTGKIDYFLASYTTGIKSIINQSLVTIKPIDEMKSIKKEDLRFGINKNNPLLYSIIEKSFSSIDKEYLANLSNKWVMANKENTDKKIDFTKEELEFIKNSPKIKIGSIDSYTPFSFIKAAQKVGFTHDLIDIISQKSGLKFEKSGGTWPQVFGRFKNGQIDIISELSYMEERLPFTLYTKPYYEIPIGVFTRDDFGTYKGIESLKGKNIGIVKNSYLSGVLSKIDGLDIVHIASGDERFYALKNKKVDVVLSNTMSIFRVEELMLNGIKLAGNFTHPEAKKEDLRFGINRDKPLLSSIMNKTLDSIPFSTITRLKQKWIFDYETNLKEVNKISLTNREKEFIKNNPVIRYSEVDWKPLSIIENNMMKGVMGDYLEIISSRTGLRFEFIPSNSWPHVLEQFKSKKIDLVPGIGSSPQELNLGLVSKTYAKYPMVIVTGKNYKYLDDLNQLKNKTVAVPKYYTSYNFILKNYPRIKLLTTSNIPEALMLVESGKADAFVGHIATSLYYMGQLHFENLKISGKADFEFNHKYLIQKEKQVLFSIINKVFDSISELERKDIYSKWVNTAIIEETVDYSLIYKIVGVFALIVLFFTYRHYELKKFNLQLKNSHEQMEAILDNSMEAILLSENLKCIDANKEAVKLFKFDSKKEVLGLNLLDFIDKRYLALAKEKVKIDSHEPYEMVLLKKGKAEFPALVRGKDILLNNKKIRITSIIDISKMKKQEELLLKQSKMAALGEMLGNIAHQWRQPLSAISTAASGLRLKKEYNILKENDIDEICDSIVDSSKYLSRTIDDFKDFVKGNKKVEKFSLNDVIGSDLRLLNGVAKTNFIEIIYDNKDDIELTGYKNELIQALINIFYNAKDALVNIESDRFVYVNHYKKENKAYIEIQDNAGGIKEEVMDKIFEPYFTTKHQSKGTGLGLYMTYQIITGMKGDIIAQNSEFDYKGNKYFGAKFTILLPLG